MACFALPRTCRLLKRAEFGVVLSARGRDTLFCKGRWLAVKAMRTERPGKVRFGWTVGKAHARRAVDRVLVKRILRESARHARPELVARASAAGIGLEVVYRLRGPVPKAGAAASLSGVKKALRQEADRLSGRVFGLLPEVVA